MKSIGGVRAKEDQVNAAGAPRPLRVLVVEDNHDGGLSLRLLLMGEGYDVKNVAGGRQALLALGEYDPDAVLLDIELPELSGWEVARSIRKRYGRQRPLIVGMSGEYRMGADRVLSEILEFDHYLLKPYDPQVVLSLLKPLTLPAAARE